MDLHAPILYRLTIAMKLENENSMTFKVFPLKKSSKTPDPLLFIGKYASFLLSVRSRLVNLWLEFLGASMKFSKLVRSVWFIA